MNQNRANHIVGKKQQARLQNSYRVLSLDPHTDRIGAAFFTGKRLVDARMKTVGSDKTINGPERRLIPAMVELLDLREPEILLLPETKAVGTRARSTHVAEATAAILKEASERGISVHIFTLADVKNALADSNGNRPKNRHEIHDALVQRFPVLEVDRPDDRGTYDPERYFTSMFDAVGMFCVWRLRT